MDVSPRMWVWLHLVGGQELSHPSGSHAQFPTEPPAGEEVACPHLGMLHADSMLVASSGSQGWGRQDNSQREGLPEAANLLVGTRLLP